MSQRNGRVDMSLAGISDTEVLAIVADQADEDGWTSTLTVRLTLGENPESVGRSGVGPRLSWLRRYGWLRQHPDDRRLWQLTVAGNELLDHPKLNKAVETGLAGLNPAQRVAVVRTMGETGYATPHAVRNALRRQWQRSMQGHLNTAGPNARWRQD